jgi:hypothetical protein
MVCLHGPKSMVRLARAFRSWTRIKNQEEPPGPTSGALSKEDGLPQRSPGFWPDFLERLSRNCGFAVHSRFLRLNGNPRLLASGSSSYTYIYETHIYRHVGFCF